MPAISLSALVFMVYEAKRRAEVAPGVGKETDIAYINKQNGIIHLDSGHLTKLDELYQAKNLPASQEFERKVEDLFPNGGKDNDERGEGVDRAQK